jgi:hypothetical protein
MNVSPAIEELISEWHGCTISPVLPQVAAPGE